MRGSEAMLLLALESGCAGNVSLRVHESRAPALPGGGSSYVQIYVQMGESECGQPLRAQVPGAGVEPARAKAQESYVRVHGRLSTPSESCLMEFWRHPA